MVEVQSRLLDYRPHPLTFWFNQDVRLSGHYGTRKTSQTRLPQPGSGARIAAFGLGLGGSLSKSYRSGAKRSGSDPIKVQIDHRYNSLRLPERLMERVNPLVLQCNSGDAFVSSVVRRS